MWKLQTAIEAAVQLSVRYITSRKLPDKAIDLMDETIKARRTAVVEAFTASKLEAEVARTSSEEKDEAIREQKFEEAARFMKEQAKRDKLEKLRKK